MSNTLSRKDRALPWLLPGVALYKGIEGKDWEEMFDSYKEMSRAVGVKKPQEAQNARALRATNAAKDRKEEFYDLALGRAPQRPNCGPGQSAEVRGRSVLKLARGSLEARQQWHAIGWCRI